MLVARHSLQTNLIFSIQVIHRYLHTNMGVQLNVDTEILIQKYLSLLANTTDLIQHSIQMSKRDEMIDRLKAETSYLKDQQRDKEREVLLCSIGTQ